MTLVGAWVGVWLGIREANRQECIRFIEERSDILKALLYSLDENHKYITQIENLHFPANQMPSYPMDTVALGHVSLNARRYLPKGTDWAQRYNKLRFELDHLNRKIMIFFIRPSQPDLDGIKTLLLTTKTALEAEIETLKKLA
jgi:hypothetical protein